ncbi:MAG: hypothetical protein NTW50_01230 [Candidatus Berkelbacteria bacterium]|nr:hypothetical protein [Candidatus Berkelbacteria bacterium]
MADDMSSSSWDLPQGTILTQSVMPSSSATPAPTANAKPVDNSQDDFQYDTKPSGLDSVDDGLISDTPAVDESLPEAPAPVMVEEKTEPPKWEEQKETSSVDSYLNRLNSKEHEAAMPTESKLDSDNYTAGSSNTSFDDMEKQMMEKQKAIDSEIAELQKKSDQIRALVKKISKLKEDQSALMSEVKTVLP